jgi:hypothetical protein
MLTACSRSISRMLRFPTWVLPLRGRVAGTVNGAQLDASFQPYLNESWDWMNSHFITGYYGSELSLL